MAIITEYIAIQLFDITATNPWNGDKNTMANGMIAPIVSLNVEINNPNIATISVLAPKIVIAIMLFLLWLNKEKAEQYTI